MGSENKQYAERDAYELDKSGGYYVRHVMAMTSEKLHAKSDIAAELGHRDMVIDQLRAEVEALRRDRKACWEELKALHRSSDATERELRAEVEALRKDAERYSLLASMVVAECASAEMTPQQAALFGSLNAITRIRTTAEFDAVFDAAMAAKEGRP